MNPLTTPETPDTRVSVEEAIKSLDNILDFLDGGGTRTSKRTVSDYYLLGETAATRNGEGTEEEPLFYLFNFADNEGFAIVGADTRLPTDVFAVADSGNIDPEEGIDNPGLGLFLMALGRGIDDWKVIPDPDITYPEDSAEGSIETYKYSDWTNYAYPCLRPRATWHQFYPYNVYCPSVGSKQTLVGCVPVAVGLLMSCWEYPSSINDYELDWELMKSGYRDTENTTRSFMVARMLRELGRNLGAEYGLSKEDGGNGTGVSPFVVPQIFEDMEFSRPGELAYYDSAIVNSELKQGYPLLAGGYSHKKAKRILGIKVTNRYPGGHQWLITDLLERTRTKSTYRNGVLSKTETELRQLVFCSWGWKGTTDNGYYFHGVFNANEITGGHENVTRAGEENNYQYKQTMYTGVRK